MTADSGASGNIATGENDSNGNSKRKRFVKVVEVDAPNNMDLDAYIANYKGHTKVNRLEFIADRCPSLQIDALKLAITELRNTSTLNVSRYINLVKKLNEAVKSGAPGSNNVSPELLNVDKAWADSQLQKAKQQADLLEGELKNYKRNSIKESIRMGNIELGNHYYDCGDLASAHRCYSRTRDYCTTSKHIIELCMNVIKVSIELGNFPHVSTYVVKAETTPEIAQDKDLIKAKLKAALGLANLDQSKYSSAARDFLSIGEELVGHQYGDVISANDIAIYGGLCALASFSRAELKRLVIDNVGFRQYLELEPHIRDLIQGFYNSNYAVCLDIMEKWRNDYLLDIHLHSHVEALYTNIRKKALVQFTSPFLTVDLTKMAKSFSTTVPALEKELVSLIIGGQIEARIDSQQKILWAKQTNKRSAIFERTAVMGQDYEREAKGLVLRIQMINNGLIVKSPASEKGPAGAGAGPGGNDDYDLGPGGPVFPHMRHGGRPGRDAPMFADARSNVSSFLSNFSRDRHRA
ncbi:26S proteasome subunit RPN7-domain-containing protein [Lobosporangium transversale]|uniref:26S proteasome subunit RPN7-domain-containing protein n=1 Tax=Lobosporangium transversale TaxID=64571 RepID=A0A1Y2H3A6_9FUNG|nr:26S proteasome subunit RPN7-domain-containing protein [Lobosporangium transversale]ORZ29040.1 26S proteasome subunit RPN7-domain-containing protein [Lobosporangium transversale]|eukprot:XP_021886713.1 26S proteasome subunit RPN7-domain-containing protein [Lobosporangium transversale]